MIMKIVNPFDGSKAKAGDRVYSLQSGWGTVVPKLPHDAYLIWVVFDEYAGVTTTFTNDGRFDSLDKTPDLYYDPPEIIGPPKPKRTVKRTLKKWANVYEGGNCHHVFSTKASAESGASYDRIACVELTGTYEVEED
jgi:hypothetical protein